MSYCVNSCTVQYTIYPICCYGSNGRDIGLKCSDWGNDVSHLYTEKYIGASRYIVVRSDIHAL